MKKVKKRPRSVNWKKLHERIPNRVAISADRQYEILWASSGDGSITGAGETRFETLQIIIAASQSPKEIVVTYLHELAHAFSEAYELHLTEAQIQKLEKAFYYLLKEGNLFNERNST